VCVLPAGRAYLPCPCGAAGDGAAPGAGTADVQRGTALLTTPKRAARARENFDISTLPEDALDEINRIQTRQRLNEVVKNGIPSFIPQGR
jgi:hypothetical protein